MELRRSSPGQGCLRHTRIPGTSAMRLSDSDLDARTSSGRRPGLHSGSHRGSHSPSGSPAHVPTGQGDHSPNRSPAESTIQPWNEMATGPAGNRASGSPAGFTGRWRNGTADRPPGQQPSEFPPGRPNERAGDGSSQQAHETPIHPPGAVPGSGVEQGTGSGNEGLTVPGTRRGLEESTGGMRGFGPADPNRRWCGSTKEHGGRVSAARMRKRDVSPVPRSRCHVTADCSPGRS